LNLSELSGHINQLPADLKAETLLALLMGDHISLREILCSCEGQLNRAWSRDIRKASVEKLSTGNEMQNVRLNRDGIYDYLPEAVIHDIAGSNCSSGDEMAKESMRLKAQEKESRLFFQPLENELFLQGIQLAMRENHLFQQIYVKKLMGIIPDFWDIDHTLPEVYTIRMLKLIPVAHIIAGNLKLTAQSLEFVLHEKIHIETREPNTECIAAADGDMPGVLGSSHLGVDFLAGLYAGVDVNHLFIRIGPVTDIQTAGRIKDGTLDKFLQCFYGYFVPVEYEIITQFIPDNEQGRLILDAEDETLVSYLGYNSIIQ
jgi:hypothetical protein